jgi:hypothetical protein
MTPREKSLSYLVMFCFCSYPESHCLGPIVEEIMPVLSLLKRLAKALPVILANAPAVIAAVKEVSHGVKKPKPAAATDSSASSTQPEPSVG